MITVCVSVPKLKIWKSKSKLLIITRPFVNTSGLLVNICKQRLFSIHLRDVHTPSDLTTGSNQLIFSCWPLLGSLAEIKWDKVVCNIWPGVTALGFPQSENVRSTFGNRLPILSSPTRYFSTFLSLTYIFIRLRIRWQDTQFDRWCRWYGTLLSRPSSLLRHPT